MYVTAFYASIIPLVLIISCIGLALHYWVQKYNVLRRRTIKHHYGHEMSLEMTEWLELVLPIYCVCYYYLLNIGDKLLVGI